MKLKVDGPDGRHGGTGISMFHALHSLYFSFSLFTANFAMIFLDIFVLFNRPLETTDLNCNRHQCFLLFNHIKTIQFFKMVNRYVND